MGGFATSSPEAENGFVATRLCFVGGVGTKQWLPAGWACRIKTLAEGSDFAKKHHPLARQMPPR